MLEAFRRILWLCPTLVVVTVLAFWALSHSLGEAPFIASEVDGATSTRLALPLFVNTKPRSLEHTAWSVALRVAQDPSDLAARAELPRIGAAALPHIWPRMDTLSPDGRERVALALVPVALRMRVAEPRELGNPEQALAFFDGYWQDHMIDFRAATVSRVVTRFATRATSLRRRELLQFDTFALPEIMQQLAQRAKAADIASARRLCAAAAHIAETDWVIPKDADMALTARVVSRWQSWWLVHRADYVSISGVERLVAPLLQTRYATWAREAALTEFGVLKNGDPALSSLFRRSQVTLSLLATGLLGGTLMGILLGALVSAAKGQALGILESTTSLLWLALPVAFAAAYIAPLDATHHTLVAALLMLGFGTALMARYQRSTMTSILQKEWVRSYRAVGASRLRIALLTLRSSSGAAISSMAPQTSSVLTAVFVIEYAFGLEGVGLQTIRALHQHDVVWLMLVTLATAALVGLIQIVSDVLLRRLDPRRTQPGEYSVA
jgi:ABC-type dipeptide/oligopeptide/nickel transport system permease component